MQSNAAAVDDLRQWLDRIRNLGELLEIDDPVDCVEEMGAVVHLIAREPKSPALLFNQPKGFDKNLGSARLLWNLLGLSRARLALTLEEPVDTPLVELIQRAKTKL